MELLEREAVLAELAAGLAESARGRGVVVAVSGEAGIGKTSVVHAFAAVGAGAARVLWGACDDLAVARPLGPFRDMAEGDAAGLAARLASGERGELFQAVLEEIGRSRPTVCVIEDAHWADEASLDVLTYLVRRVERVPVLLIVTFRDDELGLDHPLRRVLGAIPRGSERRLRLEPLSRAAVAQLAGPGGDPDALYQATGGNPFFVTETLAAGLAPTPASVRDAVLSRAARLSDAGRSVLELVSIVPARAELWLVEDCLGPADGACAECEARGLLIVDAGVVRFRHELARRAVEAALPGARRVQLNRQVLSALVRREADPARLAHHAALADDHEAHLRHALAAGRRAAASRSHREAAALLEVALTHGERLEPPERAQALEELSYEAYVDGRAGLSVRARERALELRVAIGDDLGTGDDLRWLSRLRWWAGDRAGAEEVSAEAVQVLERLPPGRELAMALSTRSQLAMLSQRHEEALRLGEEAIALASTLDDVEALVHARTNVGTEIMRRSPDEGRAMLQEAADVARRAGLDDDACRAFVNAAWNDIDFGRYEEARPTLRAGLALAQDFDQRGFYYYLQASQALVDLACGAWDAASQAVRTMLDDPEFRVVGRVPALQVLGTVELRRGLPGAEALLEEAWALARSSGELQRMRPVACARAERAWLAGDPAGVDEATREAYDLALGVGHEWDVGKLAVWRWRAGVLDGEPPSCGRPFALEMAGDWRGAAEAWRALGAPYPRALALLGADEPEPLVEALSLLEGLGAAPAAALVRARLRRLGARSVPRGMRAGTRANPANLSARQLEVARLLVEGLSNPEIAERLVLSPRTVEHHVAAVAAKLGVRSRAEAASAARDLGVAGAEVGGASGQT